MNVTNRLIRWLGGAAMLALSAGAGAATVLDETVVVNAPSLSVFDVAITTPGDYQVAILDLQVPSAFSVLTLDLNRVDLGATFKVIDDLLPGPARSIPLDAGAYKASVFAVPSPVPGFPSASFGVFVAQIAQAPVSAVPIPTPVALLGSALLALVVVGRRVGRGGA